MKGVIVEAVPRNGYAVLNADDPLVRGLRRRCSGRIVWFTMAQPGSEIRESVDDHCRRGGRAVVLEHSDLGDMIIVKEGRRAMQLAWTHLLPSTFHGRATMNVQNAMAAAAAAFAAGASLHDIRGGLRGFSTNYYLAPGRLNEVEVEGRTVIVDYAHNPPSMRMLGDFVDKTGDALDATTEIGKISRIGVVATAGDRRDDDMREIGAGGGGALRRRDHPRGHRPARPTARRGRGADRRGGTPRHGDGVRCKQVEIVLDELDATRHAIARSNPGDLIVICVDQHAAVMSQLESYGRQAQPGAQRDEHERTRGIADPDYHSNGQQSQQEPLPQI